MKLASLPSSIEFVNQSECRIVKDIAYEFPVRENPMGHHKIWLHASVADSYSAATLSHAAVELFGIMREVQYQPEATGPGGYRKSNSLGKFASHTAIGERFDVTRDTTLLLALQEIPGHIPGIEIGEEEADEFDCNMLRSVIEKARMLGAVMLDERVIDDDMGELAVRFIGQYNDSDSSYRDDARAGARSHLQAVREEYLYAAHGGPLEDYSYYYQDLNPEQEIKNYWHDNPSIVRIAGAEPSSGPILVKV